MRRIMIAVSALLLFSSAASAASPNNHAPVYWPQARFISFGARAPVPLGYYELCRHGSSVCQPTPGAHGGVLGDRVSLTAARLDQLATVNSRVNRSIRPVNDQVQFGVADRWSVNPRAGDCEDYALTKKYFLLRQGWPASSLLIATATTSRGAQHAVLIARTDEGDLILDNLVPQVRPWQPRTYQWHEIQSSTDEWTWRQIQDGGLVMSVVAELGPNSR